MAGGQGRRRPSGKTRVLPHSEGGARRSACCMLQGPPRWVGKGKRYVFHSAAARVSVEKTPQNLMWKPQQLLEPSVARPRGCPSVVLLVPSTRTQTQAPPRALRDLSKASALTSLSESSSLSPTNRETWQPQCSDAETDSPHTWGLG